ncbi:hypothetical protein CFRS1_v000693 [Colletotrichum fructicola]|nr:hypothetical protein CFRS1_v000693 [Colletotrichum fructicola]
MSLACASRQCPNSKQHYGGVRCPSDRTRDLAYYFHPLTLERNSKRPPPRPVQSPDQQQGTAPLENHKVTSLGLGRPSTTQNQTDLDRPTHTARSLQAGARNTNRQSACESLPLLRHPRLQLRRPYEDIQSRPFPVVVRVLLYPSGSLLGTFSINLGHSRQ